MSEKNCIFCKIINDEIPCEKIFETNNVIGFKDMYPQAAEHYLFVHKNHTRNINALAAQDPEGMVEIFKAIKEFTQQTYLETTGFRIVTNVNKHAGQTVFHTHFHVLGGEQLKGFGI